MKRPLVFRRVARTEFQDAAVWYEGQRAGLGVEFEFVAEVDRILKRIADQPDHYPVAEGDVREAPVSRFPYAIYYRVKTTRVTVIAVFHCSRNPAIWKRRN